MRMQTCTRIHETNQITETRYNRAMVRVRVRVLIRDYRREEKRRVISDQKDATVRFREFGFEAAKAAGKHLYPSRTQWLSMQALGHVLE